VAAFFIPGSLAMRAIKSAYGEMRRQTELELGRSRKLAPDREPVDARKP